MSITNFEYVDCLDTEKYSIISKSKDYDFKEDLICYVCVDKITGEKKYFKTKQDLIIVK